MSGETATNPEMSSIKRDLHPQLTKRCELKGLSFTNITELQSRTLAWLQNSWTTELHHSQDKSAVLFLSANSMWPLLDITISLLFLLKKRCLTNYNTSHATFSPKGKSAQHLSCHEFSVCRVVSAYGPFFPMVKFFWSCLHSPEWGPAQCKMSYSHCADQHALWALMCP